MLLRKLISDVEEENSRLSNLKLSLEESCEQVAIVFLLLLFGAEMLHLHLFGIFTSSIFVF